MRFARLLKELGHTVILYASEDNEAPCDELVTVITKAEQDEHLGNTPYQYAAFENIYPLWQISNGRMIEEIGKRKQPHDFICTIGGTAQQCVAEAHPDLMTVEYSIGYLGSFSNYRVFESRAWQHFTYGAQNNHDGKFFDTSIPGFFDPDEFKLAKKEPFALYVGRLTSKKGISIACEAAEKAGLHLKVIGHGDPALVTHGAEHLGALNDAERNDYLSRTAVLICPTLYLEPFGSMAVEAQLSGTPVVTTDFGAFTETVEQGMTGFRCNFMGEFVNGIKKALTLNPAYIRWRAIELYSIDAVKPQYQTYFDRLNLLWNEGWNTL